MGRQERPLDPAAGPKEWFASRLRELRRSAGSPSYRQMADRAHFSSTALSEAAGGRTFPTLDVTKAFVRACSGDEQDWVTQWKTAERTIAEESKKGGATAAPQEPVSTAAIANDWSSRARHDVTAAPASRPPEPRRRIGRRQWPLAAAAVALVAIGAVAGMLVLRSPVQSNGPAARSAFLGEVDLAGYCRSRGFLNVVLDGSTAYDWRCVGANTPKQSFSVIEACRWQYARPEALARYTDIHNPNSWQCWNDIVVLGRVDLDKYCLAHGYTRALLTGTTVDTYSCVSDQGRSAVIDEDSACRWAYGSRALVSSANSYFRPWEQWDCWG